ncbi:putative transcriptional regulator [Pelotomaculum propionicicum]|uniref:Putative transcriptional regulator n=1 Tax=Pelotomaculum propionicicum TaxID=258475 RepID=A0A4Y7RL69_9FIRM|nr:putative transcriptional regulator [Pelotomaculum propionicicum]
MDPQCYLLQVNKAFEKIFGWTSQEAVGMKLPTVPIHFIEDVENIFQKIKAEGQAISYEAIRRRKDGSILDVSVTVSPILAEGKTTIQIAAVLHVSEKTVETHRRNIMGKLGIQNIAGLTKYAIREGLTSV